MLGQINQIYPQIAISVLIIALLVSIHLLFSKVIDRSGKKRTFGKGRRARLKKTSKLFVFFLILVALLSIWGIEPKELWVFTSTALGFIGLGLIASWSLLSNIIAAYILFFCHPFNIGDTVKILDGDNSISGEIHDMTLFFVQIIGQDKSITNIPNNVAMQKAVVVYKEPLPQNT